MAQIHTNGIQALRRNQKGENTMFEKAARLKLRFPFRGSCTTEDLFELSLVQLDSIFKTLNTELKTMDQESLLDVKTADTEILDLQIAIVRRVVELKQAEMAENKTRKEKAEQQQKLLGILANKQNEELNGKSIEEIKAMIAAL